MQRMCCVCQKTKSDGQWLAMPVEISGPVTHGYCPECFAEVMAEIQALFALRHNSGGVVGHAAQWKTPGRQGASCA